MKRNVLVSVLLSTFTFFAISAMDIEQEGKNFGKEHPEFMAHLVDEAWRLEGETQNPGAPYRDREALSNIQDMLGLMGCGSFVNRQKETESIGTRHAQAKIEAGRQHIEERKNRNAQLDPKAKRGLVFNGSGSSFDDYISNSWATESSESCEEK